jgi:heterodisulfide reductase subunit C
MESIKVNQSIKNNNDFIEKISIESGQPVQQCYQCGKCTAGCPVAFAMDYTPNQIMRMVQFGMKEELLRSKAIWLCATCQTCTTRCPCNIELTKVMESLRIMADKEGTTPSGSAKNIKTFYDSFVGTIEKYGRAFEVAAMLQYNLNSKHFFNKAALGLPMLQKGKLKLSPSKVKNGSEIARIFSEVRRMEGEGE